MKEWVGIKIVPHKEEHQINYTIEVSKGKRSSLFITNPTIRKIINENKLKSKDRVGEVKTSFFGDNIKVRTFYPIGYSHELQNELFRQTGIASLIETRILKHAKKEFPKIKEVIIIPSNFKKKQLTKRGLLIRAKVNKQRFKFEKFVKATRDKLAKDLQKHRRR